MERQRDGLIPIGESFSGLGGSVEELRDASPQARHHFSQADQVNQLVGASEADADLGFTARLLMLCSLPRTNPGNRHQYKRVNGPAPVRAPAAVRKASARPPGSSIGPAPRRAGVSGCPAAELLGREPIRLDESRMRAATLGRSILVTGAAGSIGSELCRRIACFEPRRLLVVDQAESALFRLDAELRRRFPALSLCALVADIRDRDGMDELLDHEPADSIFHAAAYKHVPLMERHPLEAAETNVIGTWNLVRAARRRGVSSFLMISTDKAVNPSNIMGLTKRSAELVVRSAAHSVQTGEPSFVSVRFGNVLGSSGSVTPLFEEQITAGGPVTVAHPEARRYFMTVTEAAQLVLEALTMGKGSQIFVLNMGRPIRIGELAEKMIRLRGLVPGEDIAIRYSGLRPGDKLFEELTRKGETLLPTRHDKIHIVEAPPASPDALPQADMDIWLEDLRALIAVRDKPAVVKHMARLVPEYRPVERQGPEDANSRVTMDRSGQTT